MKTEVMYCGGVHITWCLYTGVHYTTTVVVCFGQQTINVGRPRALHNKICSCAPTTQQQFFVCAHYPTNVVVTAAILACKPLVVNSEN